MEIRKITSSGVHVLDPSDLAEVANLSNQVTWVHLDHNDQGGMALLVQLVGPDPDDLRDVHSRTPVPKLHMYTQHIFSAINGLARGSDGLLHFQPLKVFLTPHMLWTVFGPATTSLSVSAVNHDLNILRDKVDSQEVLPTSAFELIAALRTVMLRGQEELIASGGRRITSKAG